TAPAATAVAGAANLSSLAPILAQLATILQQLVTAIQAMSVAGGGGLPPGKGTDPKMEGVAQGGRRPG
ncbi:MAG: hypothetical protein JWL76_72, partial [Thermoleophilia bacterium]|nr:hypothetical protein [Thermoleophilia bacterium]